MTQHLIFFFTSFKEIKSQIKNLQRKPCTNHLFVRFHEHQEVYKPQIGPGKYTVLIVVESSPGFPTV